jgi:hypothetical protein
MSKQCGGYVLPISVCIDNEQVSRRMPAHEMRAVHAEGRTAWSMTPSMSEIHMKDQESYKVPHVLVMRREKAVALAHNYLGGMLSHLF